MRAYRSACNKQWTQTIEKIWVKFLGEIFDQKFPVTLRPNQAIMVVCHWAWSWNCIQCDYEETIRNIKKYEYFYIIRSLLEWGTLKGNTSWSARMKHSTLETLPSFRPVAKRSRESLNCDWKPKPSSLPLPSVYKDSIDSGSNGGQYRSTTTTTTLMSSIHVLENQAFLNYLSGILDSHFFAKEHSEPLNLLEVGCGWVGRCHSISLRRYPARELEYIH